jgi:L-asparagine oxygenase
MATEEFTIVLSDEERRKITETVEGLPPLPVSELDDDRLFTRIELARCGVPRRLAERLIDFRKNSNDYGTLLVRNLPVDKELPPTPRDGRVAKDKSSHVSEANLLLLLMHLGDPIAYSDEKEGALIQNICPVKGREGRQENTGSVYLEFHTEDGFHPHKPDFLGLFCLRPDYDGVAKTATASARRALRRIPGKAVSLLRQPLYRIRLSSSFSGDGEPTRYSRQMPVLSGDLLEPEMCVDLHAMEAMNPAARDALECLKSALMEVVVDHALEPGDMFIVDNRMAAHARTGFRPRYDGEDRWLQRMFVVQDLRRSRASRPRTGHVTVPLTVELAAERPEVA